MCHVEPVLWNECVVFNGYQNGCGLLRDRCLFAVYVVICVVNDILMESVFDSY